MKKISICLLALIIVSMLVIAPSYACNTCGCQVKNVAKKVEAKAGGCICNDKAWYNPLSWFKKCSVCDAKKALK